jgi:hypothetical protein
MAADINIESPTIRLTSGEKYFSDMSQIPRQNKISPTLVTKIEMMCLRLSIVCSTFIVASFVKESAL